MNVSLFLHDSLKVRYSFFVEASYILIIDYKIQYIDKDYYILDWVDEYDEGQKVAASTWIYNK